MRTVTLLLRRFTVIFVLGCQAHKSSGKDSRGASQSAGSPAVEAARADSASPARAPVNRSAVSCATPDSLNLSDTATVAAVAVLRDYYAALNARDYARGYDAWGAAGPPGQPTRDVFAAGYAATDSVCVSFGQPGRIEGAAGSRYIDVPVVVRAFEHGSSERMYRGSYTLRRTVVPGADSASRRWHLYGARLR